MKVVTKQIGKTADWHIKIVPPQNEAKKIGYALKVLLTHINEKFDTTKKMHSSEDLKIVSQLRNDETNEISELRVEVIGKPWAVVGGLDNEHTGTLWIKEN